MGVLSCPCQAETGASLCVGKLAMEGGASWHFVGSSGVSLRSGNCPAIAAWYLWAPTQWAHPGAVPFPPQRTMILRRGTDFNFVSVWEAIKPGAL